MSGRAAIPTASGALVTPLDPAAEQVELADVAHALAHLCRSGGHARVFCSVAQHSCLVADQVAAAGGSAEETLWALLHDATEAYLGDLPHPLEHRTPLGAVYREAEARLQAAVCERFGLPPEPPPGMKRFDRALLAAERRTLMRPSDDGWWPELDGADALEVEIEPWPPERARAEFERRFRELEARR